MPESSAENLEALVERLRGWQGDMPDALKSDLTEAAQTLSILMERANWHPIETAPRDETWLLTWSPEDGHGLGRYMNYALTFEQNWSGATHWMPLPEPPSALSQPNTVSSR